MTPNTRTRRQMLTLTGSLAVVGLAGCSTSGDGPESGGGTDAPPATEDGHDDGDDHADEDDHQETDEHGHNHDEGTPEAPMHAPEVAMRTEGDEQHFAPHMTWVEVGGTVTWHVESGTHDIVAYHPDNDRPQRIPDAATPWGSELLAEGESFEHTFDEPGVYDYFCTPHESVGMVGTVIVGEPDAHDQPALEDPQASLPDGARTELADLGTMVNEALGHTH